MNIPKLITVSLCMILLFGFDVWQLLITDLIPGDAIGYSVNTAIKALLFVLLIFALRFFPHRIVLCFALPLSFLAGIHVSFNQAGNLSGYLFGAMPLGIQIDVCHNDNDNALSLLDRSSTNDGTLASFQRTVTCEGKSGEVFGYAFIWSKTGPL